MEKKMTRMEYDEKIKALNIEQAKATQPFTDMMNAKVQEKARIKQQIAELHMRDKQLGAEYEATLQQRGKINMMYEERKLALRQQYNSEYEPKSKVPVDVQLMHNVRRCVLGCLKKALAHKCNPDDIDFKFNFNEDGTLQLNCVIPDAK